MIFIANDLIQKFVQQYYSAQGKIDNNDLQSASDEYKKLLGIYEQIQSSELEQLHKDVAYEQVIKVYNNIKYASKHKHLSSHVIIAAVLIFIFSVILFIKPAIVGFVATGERITVETNFAFLESGQRSVHLPVLPKSLELTGRVDGEGKAKVYAVANNRRVLAFDSSKNRINSDGTFKELCLFSCILPEYLRTQDFVLDVELDSDTALTLFSVTVEHSLSGNQAPAWSSEQESFHLRNGKVSLDLTNYFVDPDGDALEFLATTAPGVSVEVSGSRVSVSQQNDFIGSAKIQFIASDGKSFARVPVTIVE